MYKLVVQISNKFVGVPIENFQEAKDMATTFAQWGYSCHIVDLVAGIVVYAVKA